MGDLCSLCGVGQILSIAIFPLEVWNIFWYPSEFMIVLWGDWGTLPSTKGTKGLVLCHINKMKDLTERAEMGVCVCVCVCVRERERLWKGNHMQMADIFCFICSPRDIRNTHLTTLVEAWIRVVTPWLPLQKFYSKLSVQLKKKNLLIHVCR